MLMLALAVAGDGLVPVEGDWGKLLLMVCVAVEESCDQWASSRQLLWKFIVMFVPFEGEIELLCADCLGGGDVVLPVIAW